MMKLQPSAMNAMTDLDGEDDPVNAAAHLDAADVHERVERDEDHGPQPRRAVGDQRGAPVHDHDDEQGRDQDVVQQDQPAGDEADVRVDAALHVGVHGAGDREATGHAHVAHGGEHDGHEADDVDQRRHAVAVQLDGAEDGLRGDDDHEQDAVHHHVPKAHPAAQLLLVAELLDVVPGVTLRRSFLLCHFPFLSFLRGKQALRRARSAIPGSTQ